MDSILEETRKKYFDRIEFGIPKARYVAVKDDEGKRIMIDKILDMLFDKEREIENT